MAGMELEEEEEEEEEEVIEIWFHTWPAAQRPYTSDRIHLTV
jgi:hypothetical protein